MKVNNLYNIFKGSTGVGIANSIGASSLAILLSLGIPWLVKAAILESTDPGNGFVEIHSNGVEFTMLSLIPMVILVFLVFWARKFYLTKITGLIMFVIYLLFITFAVLVEVDILFKPNFCPE